MNTHYAVFLGLFSALCEVIISVNADSEESSKSRESRRSKESGGKGKERKKKKMMKKRVNNRGRDGGGNSDSSSEEDDNNNDGDDDDDDGQGVKASTSQPQTVPAVTTPLLTSSGKITTDSSSTKPVAVSGTFSPISTSYTESSTLSEVTTAPSSGTILIVGVGLVAIVTLLGMVALIFFRKKIKNSPAPTDQHSNRPADTDFAAVNAAYEEIREEDRHSNLPPVKVFTIYSRASITNMVNSRPGHMDAENRSHNINSEVGFLGERNVFTDPSAVSVSTGAVGYAGEGFYSLAQLPSGTGGGFNTSPFSPSVTRVVS